MMFSPRKMRREMREGRVMNGLLGVLALFGAFMLLRELPAMRRYLRMERM